MSGVLETADSDCPRRPARPALFEAALDRIRAGWRSHPAVAQIRALLPIAPAFILSVSNGRPVHAVSGTNWEGKGIVPSSHPGK